MLSKGQNWGTRRDVFSAVRKGSDIDATARAFSPRAKGPGVEVILNAILTYEIPLPSRLGKIPSQRQE